MSYIPIYYPYCIKDGFIGKREFNQVENADGTVSVEPLYNICLNREIYNNFVKSIEAWGGEVRLTPGNCAELYPFYNLFEEDGKTIKFCNPWGAWNFKDKTDVAIQSIPRDVVPELYDELVKNPSTHDDDKVVFAGLICILVHVPENLAAHIIKSIQKARIGSGIKFDIYSEILPPTIQLDLYMLTIKNFGEKNGFKMDMDQTPKIDSDGNPILYFTPQDEDSADIAGGGSCGSGSGSVTDS